jgi:uncharacterized protein YbjT (DUF2867 family)
MSSNTGGSSREKEGENMIMVTGATGNVGRQVVYQLLGTGARVRALTRNPDSAKLPHEVDVVRGDLTAPDNLDRHLEGIDAVFLVWRSLGADAAPFVNAAAKHARRIVFLSSAAVRDNVEKQDNPIGQAHADIEQSIESSGVEWTFLRPGGFATNARWWWGQQIREGDVVRWPYAAAAWAPIDERDMAAVAVRALTEKGREHAGGKYYLTGEQSLTQADQVRTIGEAIGRPLRFEEISPEAARPQMFALLSALAAEMMLASWARMATEPVMITDTVRKITGAPARTFRQWAIDHAGDFQKESAQ